MSSNIDQIFVANPITSNASTDLMYFGQSPYTGASNNVAMTFANFSAQFVLSTLATNNAILTTSSSGVVTPIALSAGQIMVGRTANSPIATAINSGTGILVANASGSITVSVTGAQPWVDQTTASVTMAVNTGYTSDAGASLVTFTLPATSAIGDSIEINGKGAGLWTIAQATGQQIHINGSATTSGAGGSLSSVGQFDNVKLRCITSNTIWTVVSQQSTGLTVV